MENTFSVCVLRYLFRHKHELYSSRISNKTDYNIFAFTRGEWYQKFDDCLFENFGDIFLSSGCGKVVLVILNHYYVEICFKISLCSQSARLVMQ